MVVLRQRRKPRCIACETRAAVSRLRCARCLALVWDEIRAGGLTEQQAVERGMLAPAAKPGRPRKKRRKSGVKATT